jgi:hypothetical protein
MLQVVLEPQVGAAGGKPQVRRVDERPAQLGKQLGEAAEDGVARHAHEDQAILLVGERADAACRLVLHFLHEVIEVARARRGAHEAVGDPEVDRAVRQGVEQGGAAPVELEHALPTAVHGVRVPHRLPQAVDIEPAAGEPLQGRDQLLELG